MERSMVAIFKEIPDLRVDAGCAAENMNVMRHLALNLLKSEASFRGSINLKRKKCMLSPSYLLKVFSFS